MSIEERLKKLAETNERAVLGGGEARVAKQHEAGKLSARDRMVVADFVNKTSDSTIGSSLSEAFRIDITDMSDGHIGKRLEFFHDQIEACVGWLRSKGLVGAGDVRSRLRRALTEDPDTAGRAPHDTLAVWADWLQSQGDARGEWLAAELELAGRNAELGHALELGELSGRRATRGGRGEGSP